MVYPSNATSIEQSAIQYKLYKETALFARHNNVYKALKLQILAREEKICMCALKAKYVAYGNLSCLEVITHLKRNYYKTTPTSLKEKSSCMTYVYDANQPLKTIINQIKTVVNFSDTGRVPYTPKHVSTTAYDLIFSTGYFTNSCPHWNTKPPADKTWENFKSFFSDKHPTWQETHLSLAGGMYPLTNTL